MIPASQRPLVPSPNDPRLSAADLINLDLRPEEVGRIIAQNTGEPTALQLLAAILKNQKKNNSNYQPAPYIFAAYQQQQIFPANPRRSYFLLQNVSAGDVLVIFEVAPNNLVDFSGDHNSLIVKQTRSIRVVGGGYFEPLVVPTNAITLFTLNAAANGVCIEGV